MKQRLTAEQINALPEYAREWIHDLASNADPAGTLAELRLLQEACQAQALLIAELQGNAVSPAPFHFTVPGQPCAYWTNGNHIVADGGCRCGKRFVLAEKEGA